MGGQGYLVIKRARVRKRSREMETYECGETRVEGGEEEDKGC